MIWSDGKSSVAESTNVYCIARDETIAGEKRVPGSQQDLQNRELTFSANYSDWL
jgi:hypothetical protein